MRKSTSYVRWLHEFLFSTYFALLVVTEEETCKAGSIFLKRLGYPLNEYVYPTLMRYHIHLPGSHSIALWWLLAVTFFVALRLLGRFAFTTVLLRNVAGFVSVAGFPVLVLPPCNITGLHLSYRICILLYLEIIISITYIFLYRFRGWAAKVALSVLLLAVHFGIWGWLTWQRIGISFWTIYLLLGFCSALLWAEYFRRSGENEKASSLTTA